MDRYHIDREGNQGFSVRALFSNGETLRSPIFATEEEAEAWIAERQAEAARRVGPR